MENVKLNDISKKYPFVYEVDGKLVVMGAGILYQFPQEDFFVRRNWNNYRETIEKIGRNRLDAYVLASDEKTEMAQVFCKLIIIGKQIEDMERRKGHHRTPEDDVRKYLADLDENQKKNVLQQLEDYVRCFHYYHESMLN